MLGGRLSRAFRYWLAWQRALRRHVRPHRAGIFNADAAGAF